MAFHTVPDHLQAVPDDAQRPRWSQSALHNRQTLADNGHSQQWATSFISEQQERSTCPASQDKRASVFVLRTRFLEQPAERTNIYYGHSNFQIVSENQSIQTRPWLLTNFIMHLRSQFVDDAITFILVKTAH